MAKKTGDYKKLDEEEYYRVGTNRGVVKVSEEQQSGVKTVSFSKEFSKDKKWITTKGKIFFFVFFFFF